MRENHEYIADQSVLATDVNPREYAHLLFCATFKAPTPPFVHTFENKSMLRKRIENLKFKNQHHMKHLLVIPAIAGLGFFTVSMNTSLPTEPTAVTLQKLNPENPEKPAEFKGGQSALINFITAETNYPKALQEDGVMGIVFVSFDIAANGKVENAKVAKSCGNAQLDAEAVRVIGAMPNWNPAESGGKTVRSQITLPFKFAV
jgi:TonB family protein